jgi:putative membrane protein
LSIFEGAPSPNAGRQIAAKYPARFRPFGGDMRNCIRFIGFGVLTILISIAGFGCERGKQNVQAAPENIVADRDGLSKADKTFVIQAEEDNIKERNLGRVALEKSANRDVRNYAQMLIDDHTKALRELVDLMEKKGIRQPSGLPEVKHEALSLLNGLSGPSFDRKFVDVMVDDHEKAVAKFRDEVTAAQDQSVREYASHILPVLEKHLQKARELQGRDL